MCTRFLRYLKADDTHGEPLFGGRKNSGSGSSLDQYCVLHTSLSSRSSATPLDGSMETLLQPYAPEITLDQGYTTEENPEAMFDMLTIQTLRERYQGAEQVEMTDGRPLINDQEFEIFVREFPIDDSISECFSSPDNPVRKGTSLPAPKSNNSTPVKQNKLKKKLQQRTVPEDNVLSDEDTKSSDSKRSKLTGISSLFGKKNKNKEGYRPLETEADRESPDITNAIINACENITNDYTHPNSKRSVQDSTGKSENSSKMKREAKSAGRRKDGSVILEDERDKVSRKGSVENGLTDSMSARGLPPVPAISSAKSKDHSFYSRNNNESLSKLNNVSGKESPAIRKKQPTITTMAKDCDPDMEEIDRLLALTDDAMIKSLRLLSVDDIRELVEVSDGLFMRRCIQGGKADVVAFLTEEFPDALSKDHIKTAIQIGQSECVRCFMEQMSLHGAVEHNLMAELFAMAVQHNRADSLTEIIPYYDADPPSQLPRDKHGDTAAHLAAKEGKLECLQVLLENGFDVWTANHDGQTVLQTALNHRQQTVYKYLILYQTCQCLLQQTTLSRQLHQSTRNQRLATHTALEQIQEQLLKCQEQFNDVMRELIANQEAILQTLDIVYKDAAYVVNKTDDNPKLRNRLETLKSQVDQLQDLFDFSPIVTSTDWMSKVIKEFQNVIEHDLTEDPHGGITPSFNNNDVQLALSSAVRNASTCNRQHICDIDQCIRTQVDGAINTLMTKKPSSSSVSPASSKSGYDTRFFHRPSVLPNVGASNAADAGCLNGLGDLPAGESVGPVPQHVHNRLNHLPQDGATASGASQSRGRPTSLQIGGASVSLTSGNRNITHLSEERIYVNDVSRVPQSQRVSDTWGAWHDNLDIKSESTVSEHPFLDSPSNAGSVCSTIVTSGVLESDNTSNWTSRFGTLTCDTSESGSDWWETPRDQLRVHSRPSRGLGSFSDDDEESVINVRLNLQHEDLPDEELMKHRLQQHLNSVEKMHNARSEFVERVVTATGRRVGKNLDPSYVKKDRKPQHGKQLSRKKNTGEKRRRGIKLFSASDVESDDELETRGAVSVATENRRWEDTSIADMGNGEEAKPWYEMSEDEESIIQSLKSEEEDDASLVCHI